MANQVSENAFRISHFILKINRSEQKSKEEAKNEKKKNTLNLQKATKTKKN